jgi:hypothetical protein
LTPLCYSWLWCCQSRTRNCIYWRNR